MPKIEDSFKKDKSEIKNTVYIEAAITEDGAIPDIPTHGDDAVVFRALWDTGATISCIDSRVIERLSLVHTGSYLDVADEKGATRKVKSYYVNLYALDGGKIVHQLHVANVGYYGIDIIIGMDVIMNGDLRVHSDGDNFDFSFCFPERNLEKVI